jgi:hypothetical protein
MNGSLLFSGSFTDFTLALTSSGSGAYQGNLNGTGGSLLGGAGCASCVFTWGGAFDTNVAQVLDGYDLQIDGVFEMEASVAIEPSSFGALKSLYNE